ncbi:U-box domain-containing protein 26 [Musa acuminata AAA Group]|uniref:U-box domain-containing protein 26 n=1 Tax=Musa acuminata AAA Group TaxID=214697 RepID=UPI0031D1A49B
MSIPELFRCPISLDLFADPVTLSTGQTYDRASIEKWLGYGNSTCPVTMQRLHDKSLVPNHTLRHLIEQWFLTASIHGDGSVLMDPINSMDISLSELKRNLRLPTSTLTTKLETLRIIKVLSSESSVRQASLVQAGFFQLLLHVLFQAPVAHNAEVTELALDGVLNLLPSADLESLNMLRKESSLTQLVFLLDQSNVKIKTALCCLLETIAACSATQELCLMLGRRQRVLQILVSLLQQKSDAQASEAAVRAVCSLCSSEANRATAIREGAVDSLIAYLAGTGCAPRSRNRSAARALATLELLLGLEIGKRKMNKNPDAIATLVKMVFRVPSDQRGSEHAVGSLLLVCCDSATVRREAIDAGVLTKLLLLLQSQSSAQAKTKARALLKLLIPVIKKQVL